jgi:chromosome segregation ATPase
LIFSYLLNRQQNTTLRESSQKSSQTIQSLRDGLQSAERELSLLKSAKSKNGLQDGQLQQRLQAIEKRIVSATDLLAKSSGGGQITNEAYLKERIHILEERAQEATRHLKSSKEAYENETSNLRAQIKLLKNRLNQQQQNDEQIQTVPNEALTQLLETIRNVTDACNKRRDAILSSLDTLHEESFSDNNQKKSIIESEEALRNQIGSFERITVNLLNRQEITGQTNNAGVIEINQFVEALSRQRRDFMEASNLKGGYGKSGTEVVDALDRYFKHLDTKAEQSQKKVDELSRSVDTLNDELKKIRQSQDLLQDDTYRSANIESRDSLHNGISQSNFEITNELNSLRNNNLAVSNDAFLARSRQTIEKAMKAIETLRKENKTLKTKLNVVDKEHNQMQNQISDVDPSEASSEEAALIENLQTENSQLREKLENIEQIGTSLKEQSEIMCRDGGDSSQQQATAAKEAAIRELNIKIDSLLDENNRIKHQLEHAQSNDNSQQLRDKLREASDVVNIANETTSSTLAVIAALRKDNLRLRQRIRLGAQAELKLIERLKEMAYTRGGKSADELEQEKIRLEEQLAEAERASSALMAQRSLLINEREYIISNSLGSLSSRAGSRYTSIENVQQQNNIPRSANGGSQSNQDLARSSNLNSGRSRFSLQNLISRGKESQTLSK